MRVWMASSIVVVGLICLDIGWILAATVPIAKSTSSPFSSNSVELLVLSPIVGTLMVMAFDRAASSGANYGPLKYISSVLHRLHWSEARSALML